MMYLRNKLLRTGLCCLFALCLTACVDNNDNPAAPSGGEEQQGEDIQVADDFESRADFMVASYKKAQPLVTQVWNTHADPQDFLLLFMSEDQQKCYLIGENSKQLVPASDLPQRYLDNPSEIQRSGFYIAQYKGRNCCMILDNRSRIEQQYQMAGIPFDPTMYACDKLTLFYHESFHAYVQEGKNRWIEPEKDPDGESSRQQVFPVVYNSRIYRKLMILSLVNALNDNSQKAASYSRAKYWLNKFNTEFANEVKRVKYTDIHEGTAEYFGRTIVNKLYPKYPLIQHYEGSALAVPVDKEAYMLSTAINLAVRDGRKDEVLSSFENGLSSPIETLLKDVAVPANYDEGADKADRDRITAELDKLYGPESFIMKPVFDLLASHRKGANTYLVAEARSGSFSSSSMGSYAFTDADVKQYSCTIRLNVLLKDVEVTGSTPLTYIPEAYFFIPVEASRMTLDNVTPLAEPQQHPRLEGVNYIAKATLTAFQKSETCNVTRLPLNVMKATDNFGNTMYFIQY